MQSNVCSDQVAPTVTDGAEALARIAEAGRGMHAMVVRLIDAVIDAKRSGAVVSLAGMPLDLWLANELSMPGAERAMVESAALVLPSLPVTWGLFREGRLSWGQVRGIVSSARRLRIV